MGDAPVVSHGFNRPELSVVIATRNRAASLVEALKALTMQTADRQMFEVVVVDNGTNGDLAGVIREVRDSDPSLRIWWVREPRRGPGIARNTGIRHARGDIVLFTDDDCVPEPDWIDTMRGAFHRDPAIVGVEGLTYTRLHELTPFVHFSANSGGGYPTCNVGYRADALRSAGGFDWSAFPDANKEDVDLAYRMMWRGKIDFEPRARVFHPARPISFWSQVRRMHGLMADELCMMFRWPPETRTYAVRDRARDPRLIDGGQEQVRSEPNPIRARALLARGELLRRRPLIYGKILVLLGVRSVYVLVYVPGAILHAWRHRDPRKVEPLVPCGEANCAHTRKR